MSRQSPSLSPSSSPQDGSDLPEVYYPSRDPAQAPIPAPVSGLEYNGPDPSQKNGHAGSDASIVGGKEVYTGGLPASERYEGKMVGSSSQPGRPFWRRRRVWFGVAVGVLIIVGVVVGVVVGTQRGDSNEDEPPTSTDSLADTPTSVDTAFGTPTSFPSSLTGSDSACKGTICGATLYLSDGNSNSNSGSDSETDSTDLFLVARGTDGAFHYREADSTGWKRNWTSLGGDFESPPAVSSSRGGSRWDIFGVVREDLSMRYKTYHAGAWDDDWTSLAGRCFSPPTVCGFDDGEIIVFTTSSERELALKHFVDGEWEQGREGGWNRHVTGYVASNPVAACTSTRSHVVALGRVDGQEVEENRERPYEVMMKRDNETMLSYWNPAGGDFHGDPVVLIESDDTFSVFSLSEDGKLYHGRWSGDDATTLDGDGPRRIGGPTFMSVPSAVRRQDGTIDVLGVDRDGRLRRASLSEDIIGADDWDDLGGFFNSAPAARFTGNDTVSVFGIGPEGSVIHGRWTVTDDGWTDGQWFDDGGDFSTRWYRPGPS